MIVPVSHLVDQVDLSTEDVFLPLLECIVNSIVSLNKTNLPQESKKIQVSIERGDPPRELTLDGDLTISGFKVIDNGEGFTDENYKSFETPFTKYNKQHGCLGVGRFTVLAAYKEYHVVSTYKSRNGLRQREFVFSNSQEEVKEVRNEIVDDGTSIKTAVYVNQPRNETLNDGTARSLDQISDFIINHLLIYYLSDALPRIEVIDGDKGVVLNEKLESIAKDNEKEFYVKGEKFKLFITKTRKEGKRRTNYLYYCANSRVVGQGKNLKVTDSIFMFPLTDGVQQYLLDVYVVSKYLDSKVQQQRNALKIAQSESDYAVIKGSITFDDIESKISELLIELYSEFARKAQEKSVQETIDYIKKNPKYRSLAKDRNQLRSIPLGSSDEKRDELLNKMIYKARKSIDSKVQKFIEKKAINESSIKQIVEDLKSRTSYDVDSLADYMSRRKAILDLFSKFLDADDSGDYRLEEDIHNLIFPMGFDGDPMDYEGHNLWILDERFLTYKFVASDKPITSISQIKSRKEPDLLLQQVGSRFDNPIGFGNRASGELSSLVIFEFKRPGEVAHQKNKTDYRWEFSELVEPYFDSFLYDPIKKNYKGNQITVESATPKFGYIIVDQIPKQLADYNTDKGWKRTPFGTWYKMRPEINLNIEVLTFRQLLDFSNQKHQGFFDKLFN